MALIGLDHVVKRERVCSYVSYRGAGDLFFYSRDEDELRLCPHVRYYEPCRAGPRLICAFSLIGIVYDRASPRRVNVRRSPYRTHARSTEQRQRSGWKGYRIIKRRVRADEDLARHKDRIGRRGAPRPLALHRHESYEDLTYYRRFLFYRHLCHR